MGIYEELGVPKIINGGGTLTKLGGSRMAPEVLAAMNEAAGAFVDLRHLHAKAGARIAELLGVESACITSGAAAGIAISAAACMTGGELHKTLQLPDTTGMPNEALMLKSHRILYDQALQLSGARIREIGVTSGVHVEQVAAAVSERTAMFFYVAEAERMRGSIPLPDIVRVLRRHGIPVVVDAAAELPPGVQRDQVFRTGGGSRHFQRRQAVARPAIVRTYPGQQTADRSLRRQLLSESLHRPTHENQQRNDSRHREGGRTFRCQR